jgi:MFS transporter, Spinster family, sphingosine-1-phosphate transporter
MRVPGGGRSAFTAGSTFALLFALMVVDFADRQVVVSTFPYLRTEFGASDTMLGALVSATSLTVALGAVPIALAVDRWGRVRSVTVMATMWSAATAACAFAPGYGPLLAARIGVGAGQAGFGPAGAALLAAVFPADRRATVLGAFQAGGPLGIVVGAVVGSMVAASWGWRAAFLVLALPGLGLALLFLRVRDYPSVRAARPGARAAGKALLQARSARGAVLGGALLLVVVSTLYTWLPTHLERAYGMAPARAGVLVSVVVLGGAVGAVGAAHAADRLARHDVRRRMLVPAASAAVTAATLGTAFAVVRPGALQLLLILAGGAMATAAVGPAAAVVLDVVQVGVHATAMSLFVLVQNLFGLAMGPVLTGALADWWGLTAALSVVAGLGVVAATALWWGSRSYARDRAAHAVTPPPSGQM